MRLWELIGLRVPRATMDLMAARVTLKAINNELTKRGHAARLEKASGYFYFVDGEATDWIDRTVERPQVGTLALDQCIDGAARHPRAPALRCTSLHDVRIQLREPLVIETAVRRTATLRSRRDVHDFRLRCWPKRPIRLFSRSFAKLRTNIDSTSPSIASATSYALK